MLAVYAAAAATLAASVLTGHAIRLACGFPRSAWLAPTIGFAALLAVAAAGAEIEGGATAALALVAALSVASLAFSLFRRSTSVLGWDAVPVAAIVLVLLALPFLASGRVGVLGMGSSNDMVDHLTGAYWLQAGAEGVVPRPVLYGYPLGPQSLAASLGQVGLSLPAAFTGIMFAAPVLAAISALAAFPQATRPVRWWAAVLVGIPYLLASYFGQGEFAEVIAGVLILALALTVREVVQEESRAPLRSAVPVGLVAAGMVSTYSYLGLVWPLTLGAFVLVIHVLSTRARVDAARSAVVRALPLVLVAAVVLLVAAGAQATRIARFADAPYANTPRDRMGNLVDPISPLAVLGVWPTGDVRARPEHEVLAAIGGTAALGALVLALVWWARRRELVILAAVAACALVYAQASLVKNPYAAAKALPVAAPLVALVLAVPWLDAWSRRRRERSVGRRGRSTLVAAAGAALALGATASTAVALRDVYVGTHVHGKALGALRPDVAGSPTLFLGYDDFAHWYLRDAELTTVGRLYARSVAPLRREKPWLRGQGFDFDSVDAETLDRARFVIAPRTPYASSPPENFVLRRENRWYGLWERTGPTRPRSVPPGELGAPGAMLDCSSDGLARFPRDGVAAVLSSPVVAAMSRWKGTVDRGDAATQTLELPAGRWDVALQYASRRPLRIEALDLAVTVPANLGRIGPHWLLGTVHTAEPTHARVRVTSVFGGTSELTRAYAPTRAFNSPDGRPLGEIVATPHPWRPRIVPLREACGRYVDWYARSR